VTAVSAEPRVVAEAGERGAELWPSVGEYPVYDAFVYHLMTHDEVRNARYREALAETARGKVVVDVGTGQDLLWARAAAESGARHVYAIESLPDVAERAAALGRELGASSSSSGCPIDVISGFSQDAALAEPADVCVIEMVGSIGSAEGIAGVAHDARHRLLAPGGLVIPARIVTRACGITLPDDLADDPGFTVSAADYVEQIWASTGTPFDVRLAIRGVEPSHVLTASAPIEDLVLGDAPAPAADVEVTLPVERPGRLHGLLVWTQVWTRSGGVPPLETFPTTGSGLPVYVPLFQPGVRVTPGGALTVAFWRRPGADGFHPDYRFEGVLDGTVGAAAAVELPYAGGRLGQNAFYAALWSG
jgi:protein arginine N-methyltransferase 1